MAPPPETGPSERLVLASASTARAALLRAAAVDVATEPAAIDEAAIKQEARRNGESAIGVATILATEKARTVSLRDPDSLVIGADQVLACGTTWFDKPRDLGEAREQLRSLRGRTHVLATAVCAAQAGVPVWRATSAPELTMRRFSDKFLDAYLAAESDALLSSVGAYRLEGRGVQLFSRISGDYFAILGLPLVELLGFLRERGKLAT
ncbi:MAG: Maf family protein [Alphaproteobacteria bacterium]